RPYSFMTQFFVQIEKYRGNESVRPHDFGWPDLSVRFIDVSDGILKTVPNELMNIREFVIQFSADGVIRQSAVRAIALQGAVSDFEHLEQILIVQQFLTVDPFRLPGLREVF